ncbi:MAG TPA: MFS transporter [Blastocatellia bacterium]|nr:MFS transporter [Blastocatellia bacterium]HMV81916.1 MFS transporter [Blastocatellia bacterium]HMX26362.1 MFS transporter [Blastocatellia bacterium]HMY75399.1 MFS transporter [Blastocatellia bacterium]HMZ16390.1 MFS transporter [Blastocatellia bacterium]
MDAMQQQQLSFGEVMRIPAFRRLWAGQVVSLFGDFLAIFAVLSYASFKLHATATQITFITVSFLVPFAFFGPIAGVFVDRWNLKRTMIASDLIRAGLILALTLIPNLYGIYALLLALSFVSTFFIPAQSVTLRTLVPPNGLLSANAMMQQAMQVVRIITPALAGSLVGWFGAYVCYLVDGGSFLFSAFMIAPLIIHRAQTAEAPTEKKTSVGGIVSEFGAGMKFILTHAKISFVILALTAGMFAISCFGPLVAVFVRDNLKANEFVFGVVNSLIGIGMILCTIVISKLAQARSKSKMVIEGLLVIGVSVAVMAGFGNIPMAAVGMFGIGVGSGLIMIPSMTLIQTETPMEMVGRVSSSVWSLLSIAQVIGLIFSGSLAAKLGVVKLFYLSAVLLVLIAAFGFFRLQAKTPPSPDLTASQA